jgi:hypothetical protein
MAINRKVTPMNTGSRVTLVHRASERSRKLQKKFDARLFLLLSLEKSETARWTAIEVRNI